MKTVDLYADCPACHGQGELYDRDFRPSLDLGQHVVLTPRYTCGRCGGKGVVLSEPGRTILGLVRAAGVEGIFG